MKDAKKDTKKEGRSTVGRKKMKSSALFNHEQLNKALHAVQDLMERLGGCPFYPLHDTCKSINRNWQISVGEVKKGLEGEGIYIGIKESEFTKQRQSMLETLRHYFKYEIKYTKKGFTIELGGVPIYVTIIKKNYGFFKNPNIVFWGVTEFLMPNPVNDYLKAQWLIK